VPIEFQYWVTLPIDMHNLAVFTGGVKAIIFNVRVYCKHKAVMISKFPLEGVLAIGEVHKHKLDR